MLTQKMLLNMLKSFRTEFSMTCESIVDFHGLQFAFVAQRLSLWTESFKLMLRDVVISYDLIHLFD